MSEGLKLKIQQLSPIPLDAELSCAPGEVLALVGPSGSGKSTLLRSIAGLYQVQNGAISCDGDVWLDSTKRINQPTAQRRVGMVFQSFALFPHLSALENVAEAMLDLPRKQRLKQAQAWLDRVHLHDLKNRLPHQLSGGQQQRVALARALARQPRVLLMDEPFSAVDRATRESLYQELAELRNELLMPVILVTHDLDEATLLSDRMCILSEGNTLQTDTPDQILQAPKSTKVARLLGMRNLFNGRVVEQNADATILEWGALRLTIRRQNEYSVGTTVSWGLPTSGVLLMPTSKQVGTTFDNQIPVNIEKMLSLGEQFRVTLLGQQGRLTMNVPRHIAQRYGLLEGQALIVRLRGDTVHLMPYEA